MMHMVVMAGGSGTRFWPQSRRGFPKQFLTLTGARSLIQMTVERCADLIPAERVWVVTNVVQAETTRRQLPEVPAEQILAEPCARNTAPCVAWAAAQIAARDAEATMLVLPADHVIHSREAFQDAVREAEALVSRQPQRLILFGARPNYASTGFGYIEQGPPLADFPGAYEVQAFREKPDRVTAEGYLRAGTFFWNCGIFVWSARRILQALQKHEPEIADLASQLVAARNRPDQAGGVEKLFPLMKSISIDYAVLERETELVALKATFDWDDVGSWEAVARLAGSDEAGNTFVGPHCSLETRNCIVQTTPDHLVATLGLEDCIVVHTADATLVARRSDENAIKELIEALRQQGYENLL